MRTAFRVTPRVGEDAPFEILTDGKSLYWPAGNGEFPGDLQTWLDDFNEVRDAPEETEDIFGFREHLKLTQAETDLADREPRFVYEAETGRFDRLAWPKEKIPADLRKTIMSKRDEAEGAIARQLGSMWTASSTCPAPSPSYVVDRSTSEIHSGGAIVRNEFRWSSVAPASKVFRADRPEDADAFCRSMGIAHPSECIEVLLPEMVRLRPELERLRKAVEDLQSWLSDPPAFAEPDEEERFITGRGMRTSYDNHEKAFDAAYASFDLGIACAIQACIVLRDALHADASLVREIGGSRLGDRIEDAIEEAQKLDGAAEFSKSTFWSG